MGKITEEWLAECGFKYRDPLERQPFRHWTLTFAEPDNHGLCIETTMPGWLNRYGDHVGSDGGWFVWIGRDSQFLHVRRMYVQSEMVALVEALAGQAWGPSRRGLVPIKPTPPPQQREDE